MTDGSHRAQGSQGSCGCSVTLLFIRNHSVLRLLVLPPGPMPQGRWGHRLLLPALGTKGQGCSPPYPSAWGSSPPAHPPSLGSWQPLGPGRAHPAPAVAPGLWHRPQRRSAPALPGPWCQLCPIPAESRSLQRLTGPGPFTGPCLSPSPPLSAETERYR